MTVQQTAQTLLVSGASLGLLAVLGLYHDIGWIAQPFYAYAWWSYIFMLDGFCAMRRGSSLLTTRRRFVLPMCLWSITFWMFFEFLNVRFQNWYYVGVFPLGSTLDLLGGGIFVMLSFSTVFTGIFETIDALSAARLFRRWRGTPGKFPRWVSYAVQALGAFMAGVAILFPHYLAPLIWGSFTFLVDPWNYRRGARSILRDFEARDWGLVARVFVAGLVCGLVWESLNFFAPQKWIYTVRGLESFKLFEMPLLGFLGFPGLAYDAMAGFSLLASIYLGNETWEHPDDLTYRLKGRRPLSTGAIWRSLPFQICFWMVVAYVAIDVNIGSMRLELEDLGLAAAEVQALENVDIRRPRQLLRVTREPGGLSALREKLGWSGKKMDDILARGELYTFKGIGRGFGALLESVSVRRVSDLRKWSAVELHSRLNQEAARLGYPLVPRLDMVRVWVLAGRDRGVVLGTN